MQIKSNKKGRAMQGTQARQCWSRNIGKAVQSKSHRQSSARQGTWAKRGSARQIGKAGIGT
jgi:hypothetical protein